MDSGTKNPSQPLELNSFTSIFSIEFLSSISVDDVLPPGLQPTGSLWNPNDYVKNFRIDTGFKGGAKVGGRFV